MIEKVAPQVMENCRVSDARNWGSYSVCGLLLRLTELYRWEKKVEPWSALDHSTLLEWVDEQERAWEALSGEEFREIEIKGKEYPPFGVDEINQVLWKTGYLYGAGFVGALKPSFFLGKLESSYREDGFEICILGKELARDLVSYPAMLQGRKIIGRTQTLGYFLWDKLQEARASPGMSILRSAFKDYGYDFAVEPEGQTGIMGAVIKDELQSLVRHELGEALDGVFPSEDWAGIIKAFPQSRIEHLTRGVKDVLADTHEKGMLGYIIREEKLGSLGLYAALLFGYRKLLMPEMGEVYLQVRDSGDWEGVEEARRAGLEKAEEYAEGLVEAWAGGGRERMEVEAEVTRRLLDPLKV